MRGGTILEQGPSLLTPGGPLDGPKKNPQGGGKGNVTVSEKKGSPLLQDLSGGGETVAPGECGGVQKTEEKLEL